MDPAPILYHGSCLCGAIRYAVRSEIKAVSHCHCSMCRKAHGAAFASHGSVPTAAFSIVEGAQWLRQRSSSPGVTRSFCGQCGSPLTWQRDHGDFSDWTSFSLGTLDTPFTPRKQRHLYGDAVPAWHPLHGTQPHAGGTGTP
ncbi:GFA family protein [Pseudorhodoferax sp.]|uniref:GFA family protein n=1 Tax=Pseudorhodoferax sp. TaxID=1993553 RepID=UPI002DD68AE9|nr:GFA family protein [Pseudorhodoferax sp.]